jgi:hypothetical protein
MIFSFLVRYLAKSYRAGVLAPVLVFDEGVWKRAWTLQPRRHFVKSCDAADCAAGSAR